MPSTGLDSLDLLIFIIVIPFLIAWPVWYMLKWLGVRWEIVIERDEKKVGTERVRWWGASGRRIDELTRDAAAGALSQQYPAPEPAQ